MTAVPAARSGRAEPLLTDAARAGLRSAGFRWAIAPAMLAWTMLALKVDAGQGLEICFGAEPGTLGAIGAALRAKLAQINPVLVAADWLLMVVAVMLPLALPAIAHVAARSYLHRRMRSLALFTFGFGLIWFLSGGLAVPALLVADAAIDSTGLGRWGGVIGCAVAALWQVTPAKARAVRRCHFRPSVPAVGWTADLGALTYGLGHGWRCLRSCLAVMVPPMLGGQHLLVMAVLAPLLLAERATDRPSFRVSALVLLLLGVATSV